MRILKFLSIPVILFLFHTAFVVWTKFAIENSDDPLAPGMGWILVGTIDVPVSWIFESHRTDDPFPGFLILGGIQWFAFGLLVSSFFLKWPAKAD